MENSHWEMKGAKEWYNIAYPTTISANKKTLLRVLEVNKLRLEHFSDFKNYR